MTARHFVFEAAGTYNAGRFEIGGELDTDDAATFVDGVNAALTSIMRGLLAEYPDGCPFRITRLTIELTPRTLQ